MLGMEEGHEKKEGRRNFEKSWADKTKYTLSITTWTTRHRDPGRSAQKHTDMGHTQVDTGIRMHWYTCCMEGGTQLKIDHTGSLDKARLKWRQRSLTPLKTRFVETWINMAVDQNSYMLDNITVCCEDLQTFSIIHVLADSYCIYISTMYSK